MYIWQSSVLFPLFPNSALRNLGFTFKRRGEIEVKGKGSMVTHFLISDGTTIVQEPTDDFTDNPTLTDDNLAPYDRNPEDKTDSESVDGRKSRTDSGVPDVNKKTGEVEAKGPEVTEGRNQRGASGGSGKGLANQGSACAANSLNRSRIVVPDYSFLSASNQDLRKGGRDRKVIEKAEGVKGGRRESKLCLLL